MMTVDQRSQARDQFESAIADVDKHAPAVGCIGAPVYQSTADDAIQRLGQRRMIHEHRRGQVSHRPPLLVAQHFQNPPVFRLHTFFIERALHLRAHLPVGLREQVGKVVRDRFSGHLSRCGGHMEKPFGMG